MQKQLCALNIFLFQTFPCIPVTGMYSTDQVIAAVTNTDLPEQKLVDTVC